MCVCPPRVAIARTFVAATLQRSVDSPVAAVAVSVCHAKVCIKTQDGDLGPKRHHDSECRQRVDSQFATCPHPANIPPKLQPGEGHAAEAQRTTGDISIYGKEAREQH